MLSQTQEEIEELIRSICATYKEFSQKNAEIASHLECIAAEAGQRDRDLHHLDPLPELADGPDEVRLEELPSRSPNNS